MQFMIEDTFWTLFPDALIGVVVARGFDNRASERPDIAALLGDAVAGAAAALEGADIAAHADVAPWRRAYQTFGAKPSKYRSSIESLLPSGSDTGPRRSTTGRSMRVAVPTVLPASLGGFTLSASLIPGSRCQVCRRGSPRTPPGRPVRGWGRRSW